MYVLRFGVPAGSTASDMTDAQKRKSDRAFETRFDRPVTSGFGLPNEDCAQKLAMRNQRLALLKEAWDAGIHWALLNMPRPKPGFGPLNLPKEKHEGQP